MKNKPGIEILIFDKDNNPRYGNGCKLKIDRISSQLLVEYFIDENKSKLCLKASFKWKFIQKKNIIFVFDPAELQNFALIFKNRTISKTVHSAIYKNKVKDFIDPEFFQQRIILPIIKKISENTADKEKLIKILSKWLNFYQREEKSIYLELLKENNVYEIFYPNKDVDDEKKLNESRKRRFRDIENNDSDDFGDKETKKRKYPKINYVNSNMNFKFGYLKTNTTIVKSLILFTSNEKSHCFEYKWSSKRQKYYCSQCQTRTNSVTAIIDVDDASGNLCVKFEDKAHSCPELPYTPSKFTEGKLLQKPNYEILEEINSKIGRLLIIFNSDNRNECHQFRWKKQSKHFFCDRCRMAARVYNENLKNEYLEMNNIAASHDCPMIPYKKEKYYQFNNYILPGNFEIQKQVRNGKEKKWLIIYANFEKTKFYKYWYSPTRNLFFCYQCRNNERRIEISARLCQNDDGEEYIILSNKSHLCTPYLKENDDNKILRHPDFQLMEETASGIPKIFIFTSKSQIFCYIFTQSFSKRTELLGKFSCLGCSSKAIKGGDREAFVNLHKDENEQYFVKLSDRKHLCQPRKYEPEKYGIQQKIYDFILCSPKTDSKKMYAVILDPKNKKLCFKFLYKKKENLFMCFSCEGKGKYTVIKLQKDENEKEFFYFKQHICNPIKLSTIQGPKYKILSNAEIKKMPVNEESEKKKCQMPKNIDESKIIRLPNFQLQKCKKTNNENGRLIIYASKDKKLKYDLYFSQYFNVYKCSKCERKKRNVSAKLWKDETGENYVILGKNDHICEPIKDEEEENKNTNFELHKGKRGVPNKKLIVFTSDEKEFYRDYFWVKTNLFQCCGCGRKSYVFVKLVEDENGQKYVKECKNKHICEPKKYNPDQGNPLKLAENEKLISSECFEFHKNKNGETDKKLFIFTTEKKELFYAYRFFNTKETANTPQHTILIYGCDGCAKLNRHITVTVIVENETEEKYVKINSSIEHVCEPKKYDSEKYAIFEEQQSISSDGYKIHEYQKLTGSPNKILIVFTSAKRDFVYEYRLQNNSSSSYCCTKCAKNKVSVRANIVQNKNGEECLILGANQHVCKPVKYDPKKYSKLNEESTVLSKDMFELHKNPKGETDKRLIVFISDKKDLMHEYLWEYKTSYRCGGCRSQNKKPSKAKIIKDENDEIDAVELLPGEHSCIPKKYDSTKYTKLDDAESRIFSSDRYKLEKNSKGEENKKLIFFISDKKDYVYEYFWYKGTIFKCQKCATKTTHVSASLFEDVNGKQCVRFGKNEHVCKPKKYVA